MKQGQNTIRILSARNAETDRVNESGFNDGRNDSARAAATGYINIQNQTQRTDLSKSKSSIFANSMMQKY